MPESNRTPINTWWMAFDGVKTETVFVFVFCFQLNSNTSELMHGVKLSIASVFLLIRFVQAQATVSTEVCSVNYSCEIEFTFVWTVWHQLIFMSRVPFGYSSANHTKLLIIWFFNSAVFVSFFLKIAQLFSGSLCTFSQIDWHFSGSRDFFFGSNIQFGIRNVRIRFCWSGQFIGYCPRHCSIYGKITFNFCAHHMKHFNVNIFIVAQSLA